MLLLVLGSISTLVAFSSMVTGLISTTVWHAVVGTFMILLGAFWLAWPSSGRPGQEDALRAMRPWLASGWIGLGLANLIEAVTVEAPLGARLIGDVVGGLGGVAMVVAIVQLWRVR